jgi:putative transcriptional regulator
MTIHHHPSDELLLDYASGALGEAWSLALATHLALCTECRRTVEKLEAVGGGMLEAVAPEPVGADALDAVMARLDDLPEQSARPVPAVSAQKPAFRLPQPLRDYVGGDVEEIDWQRLGLGAYQLLIPTGTDGATARLLRIPAGKPVPAHTHQGMELTLVLCGAFSDDTGDYARGDLQEADAELEHQPVGAPGEDCICLAITDAPLRFKSFAARLVQPLINI